MFLYMVKEYGILIVECFGFGRLVSFIMIVLCFLMVLRIDYKLWVMVNCGKVFFIYLGFDVFCCVLEGLKLKVVYKFLVKGIWLKNEEKIFFIFICM